FTSQPELRTSYDASVLKSALQRVRIKITEILIRGTKKVSLRNQCLRIRGNSSQRIENLLNKGDALVVASRNSLVYEPYNLRLLEVNG
ncbi:MAG: hypothetical protein RQ743_02125, partial [Bacteroidales bacterium]|nr:hypothetical protein [Bacteroidales bacterium]